MTTMFFSVAAIALAKILASCLVGEYIKWRYEDNYQALSLFGLAGVTNPFIFLLLVLLMPKRWGLAYLRWSMKQGKKLKSLFAKKVDPRWANLRSTRPAGISIVTKPVVTKLALENV